MNVNVSFSNSSTSSSSSSSMDVEEAAPINNLPFDILDKIFSMLSDIDRAEAREVCSLWSEIIKPIPYPHVTVYGVKEWEKYFGYTVEGEVPKLPSGIIRKVELMRSQLKGEEEAPPCSLTLIPKGLTFNKLRPLIENPKKEHSTPIRYIYSKIVEEFGDKAIDKTCWLLFTEGVVEGSRGETYENQKALITERTNSECMLPGFLEAIVCVAFKCAKTGERIFGLSSYTRCEEKVDGYPLVVGGFSSSGLFVNSHFYGSGSRGVAACRKFF